MLPFSVLLLRGHSPVSKLLDLLVGETSRDKYYKAPLAEHKNVQYLFTKQSMTPLRRKGDLLSTHVLKETSNMVRLRTFPEAPFGTGFPHFGNQMYSF